MKARHDSAGEARKMEWTESASADGTRFVTALFMHAVEDAGSTRLQALVLSLPPGLPALRTTLTANRASILVVHKSLAMRANRS